VLARRLATDLTALMKVAVLEAVAEALDAVESLDGMD